MSTKDESATVKPSKGKVGDTIVGNVPDGRYTVEHPDGRRTRVQAAGGGFLYVLDGPGTYTVRDTEDTTVLMIEAA